MPHTDLILFLNLGAGEVFMIVVLTLLFFGSDKLPGIARALGKGMQEMKNATAEIQREIEKGATEVQRDINIKKELDELNEVTNTVKGKLTDGLASLEDHYKSPEAKDQETPATPENNPLVPPDAIKRD